MHIVLIGDHAHINGGQAKVAIESALGLAARGHRVTYFAAVGPVDPRLPEAGVEVVCLGQDDITTTRSQARFLLQTMWNREAARRLAALLAACNPAQTVVHVHAWAKALSPAIGPVLRRAQLASLYTMHEFFLVCPTGGFYDYNRAEPCTRVPLSASCIACNCDGVSYSRKVLRMGRQVLLDQVSGLKDVVRDVITISALQEEVVRPFMPRGTVFHRVDNPISMPDLGPKGRAGETWLFVGRLSTEKGVRHFCEAARLAGVVATLVGDGPLREELEGRYPEARFLGWKEPDEVRRLMRAARALVFPSVWYEGQPLVVWEALALGTPLIVSDVCAGREAIVPGENGTTFRSADAADLADAIRRVDADADTLTAGAYRHYWAHPLTPERHFETLEAVYRGVLTSARERAQTVADTVLLPPAGEGARQGG